MNKKKEIKIAIIGAGRLGIAMAQTITSKNKNDTKVISIASPTKEDLKKAKKILGEPSKKIKFTKNNKEAVAGANCIFICTPDDRIKTVCREIFDRKKKKTIKENIFVIHFSGSRPLKDLESAKKAGAGILSIHPLKSFASIPGAIKTMENTEYGITYTTPEEGRIAKTIVKTLGGNTIIIEDSIKPMYHAAACIASNYLVTLIDYAVHINKKIGIKPEESIKGLLSLAEGTIKNINETGTKKSLTGPIARGDTGTIRDHMKNLIKYLGEKDTEIYKIMGIKTASIAKQNKWIENKTYNELLDILDKQAK